MFEDIARFGYGAPTPVGGVMTPTMVAGASNPVGAYMNSPDFMSPLNENSFPAAPGAPGSGGMFGNGVGLGFNAPTLNLALGGLQTIGNLWQAWETNKLAKEQFKFTKDFANTNMANQIQSYNTSLEDRIRARTFTEGGSTADAQAYIDQHKLRRQ